MDSFTINGTEFGIDRQRSRLSLARIARGKRRMSLSVHGDQRIYDAVTATEDSEWFWTLYPPEFYLRGFPVPSESPFSVRLSGEDCEKHDIALYMMEHGPIQHVTVCINRGQHVEVHGEAELSGTTVEFTIHWDIEAGA